jgi:hypothetical protein
MPAMHSKEQILKDKNESLMARVMREKKGLVILVIVRCLPGAASRGGTAPQRRVMKRQNIVKGEGIKAQDLNSLAISAEKPK